MALRLTIENFPQLPDGGPITFTVTGKRSVDIGRDQHLDWTLPDPTRFISGKHCEIHYKNDAYWLHDLSTNGTFLNGSDQRMRSPHQLKHGDRLVIGQYIVCVALEGGSPSVSDSGRGAASQQHAAYAELWANNKDAPPPINRQQIKIARESARPVNPDFLDWAAGVPGIDVNASPRQDASSAPQPDELDWASGRPSSFGPAAEPAPPVAAPRRPVWQDADSAVSPASPFVPAQPNIAADAPVARPEVPRPVAASPPAASVAPAPSIRQDEADAFVRRLARAASLPEDFFAGTDSGQLADQFGDILRLTVTSMMMLLQARNEAKRLTRSTSQTTIQATENNPLKFSPTPEDAMRILFGPRTHSYLEARRAFSQGFDDLKSHQLKTYMAMQHAVAMLVADLDPAAIATDMEADGIIDKVRSRKSRLWDAFLARWKANFGREKGAAIEAFMLHFADYYDQDGRIDSR